MKLTNVFLEVLRRWYIDMFNCSHIFDSISIKILRRTFALGFSTQEPHIIRREATHLTCYLVVNFQKNSHRITLNTPHHINECQTERYEKFRKYLWTLDSFLSQLFENIFAGHWHWRYNKIHKNATIWMETSLSHLSN